MRLTDIQLRAANFLQLFFGTLALNLTSLIKRVGLFIGVMCVQPLIALFALSWHNRVLNSFSRAARLKTPKAVPFDSAFNVIQKGQIRLEKH